MAKALGAVLQTIYGPVSGFVIEGGKGIGRGIANTVAALSGPVTFATYAFGNAISGLASKSASRPETAESSIKSPLPVRVDAFGICRLSGQSLVHP